MLKSMLVVGAGSFVGGMLRYLISLFAKSACGVAFPWGTLAVNLVGSFVIGLVYALFARYGSVSHPACLLLATGVCGGFTTFSAFANEGVLMLHNGHIWAFVCYALTSVVVGVALVALGYWIVK
jgi:CrcB protein